MEGPATGLSALDVILRAPATFATLRGRWASRLGSIFYTRWWYDAERPGRSRRAVERRCLGVLETEAAGQQVQIDPRQRRAGDASSDCAGSSLIRTDSDLQGPPISLALSVTCPSVIPPSGTMGAQADKAIGACPSLTLFRPCVPNCVLQMSLIPAPRCRTCPVRFQLLRRRRVPRRGPLAP